MTCTYPIVICFCGWRKYYRNATRYILESTVSRPDDRTKPWEIIQEMFRFCDAIKRPYFTNKRQVFITLLDNTLTGTFSNYSCVPCLTSTDSLNTASFKIHITARCLRSESVRRKPRSSALVWKPAMIIGYHHQFMLPSDGDNHFQES